MHTYSHDASGVTIHHDGDYGGDAIVVLPLDKLEIETERGVGDSSKIYMVIKGLPTEAFANFGRKATLDQVTEAVEGLY